MRQRRDGSECSRVDSREGRPRGSSSRVPGQTRKSRVNKTRGPRSPSTTTALKFLHLPNGPPSFSGPKGTPEHDCNAVVVTNESPLEEHNPPSLMFEMER